MSLSFTGMKNEEFGQQLTLRIYAEDLRLCSSPKPIAVDRFVTYEVSGGMALKVIGARGGAIRLVGTIQDYHLCSARGMYFKIYGLNQYAPRSGNTRRGMSNSARYRLVHLSLSMDGPGYMQDPEEELYDMAARDVAKLRCQGLHGYQQAFRDFERKTK